jgi:4-diphosphocytidyl-2-C-methyl-D-erythritol kinase
MKSVSLKAYAKINLGLCVLGRRADGFHELRTVYQSVSLADDLDIHLSSRGGGIRLETSGLEVPQAGQNLAVRAAEALTGELGLRHAITIHIRKRIPLGSGLGGASSDAAAAIRGLLYLTGKKLDSARLLRLAAALGSDVPFFLFGGTALGIGRGEEVYPLPEPPRRSCVILFPRTSVSTAEAYQRLRRPLLTTPGADHTIDLFCARANEAAWAEIGNDFEDIVFSQIASLGSIKKTMLRFGAEMASLSGSGSAVFGLFRDRATALRCAGRLPQSDRDVFLVRTISRREFEAQIPSVR